MNINTIVKKKRAIGGLTAVILTIISFIAANNAVAMPPLAVGLLSFTVTPQNNAALVEWETATELGAAGFRIRRKLATEPDADFVEISGFISAIGDVATGAEYSYPDSTAVNGQTYTYQLNEVENGGNNVPLETINVTIGVQATATPITVGGSSNTATPTATTSTSAATATATATTSTSNPTATPQPTTASATIVPTRASDTSNPTATAIATATNTPIAVASTSDETDDGGRDSSTVFAQGNTPAPAPTTDAYPGSATGNGDSTSAAVSTSYPAENEQVVVTTDTIATPYPSLAVEETTSVDDGYADSNGVNVIGSDSTANNSDSAAADNDSSTGYLWIGFLLALAVFVAGLIGTAVLFIRKK